MWCASDCVPAKTKRGICPLKVFIPDVGDCDIHVNAHIAVNGMLAIHRPWSADGRGDPREWKVTHVPTGLGCSGIRFRLLSQAKEFVAAIEDLTDWSKIDGSPSKKMKKLGKDIANRRESLITKWSKVGAV